MPNYTIKDPSTGRSVKIKANKPPTQADAAEIFASMAPQKSADDQRVEDSSTAAKAGGVASKLSNIAKYVTTAVGGVMTGKKAEETDVQSQEKFKKANELTRLAKEAKQAGREEEATQLLNQSRAVMEGSEQAVGELEKGIENYRVAADITDKDMEMSNMEFARRRGYSAALEAASFAVPGKIGKTGFDLAKAGGRIADKTVRGAIASSLAGGAEAAQSAEDIGEAAVTVAGSAATGAVTSAALASLPEILTGSKKLVAKAKTKIKSFYKHGTKITEADDLAFMSAAKAKSKRNLLKKYGTIESATDDFKARGFDQPDTLSPVKNKYGDYVSKGHSRVNSEMDDYYKKVVEPSLKASKKTYTRKALIDKLEGSRGEHNKEVIDEAVSWLRENGKQRYSANNFYNLSKKAASKGFTKAQKAKTSLSGSSQVEIRNKVIGMISGDTPKMKPFMNEVSTMYAWRDVVDDAFQKNFTQQLAQKSLPSVSRALTGVGGVTAGAGVSAYNPPVGVPIAVGGAKATVDALKGSPLRKFASGPGTTGLKEELTKQLANMKPGAGINQKTMDIINALIGKATGKGITQ